MVAPSKTTQWVHKKSDLQPSQWVLSRDIGTRGAKMFASFATHAEMVAHLDANLNGAFYEVIVTADQPSYMYFDIDIPDTEDRTNHMVSLFCTTLSAYLKHAFGMDVAWHIGTNCQIATASTSSKCSIHFLGYCIVESITQHRLFNIGLVEYIIENDIQDLLFINKKQAVQCAIDPSVYSNFRSYRCLHMSKLGKNNPLQPFGGSSHTIVDHLVCYYDGLSHTHSFKLPTINACRPCVQETKAKECVPQTTPVKQEAAKNKPKSIIVKLTKRSALTEDQQTLVDNAKVLIENNAELQKLLAVDKVRTSYVYINAKNTINAYIDKMTTPTCPFAKRAHKSNHIHVSCLPWSPIIRVGCHHPVCAALGSISILSTDGFDAKHPHHEAAFIDSLHSQEHNIPWTHVYDEPSMRPYPEDPIVCIRAGMGIGKTVALKTFADTHFTPSTKAIIVTFSRNLAKKYANDFGPKGFVSYQDVDSMCINDGKVIVCLDSLWRVTMRNPEYVFIDEALSVFMHFNSHLMSKSDQISTLLELLILQSKHTFFIDACIDNAFMVNVVGYFSKLTKMDATWIYNQHVRPTNRHAIIKCYAGGKSSKTVNSNPLAYAAFNRVLKLLDANKRVVVCSSTKRFTNVLADMVKLRFPDKKLVVYNSDTMMGQAASMIDTSTWNDLDVLIYSPSITAGVSFEDLHFDCLVGYLVNSPYTPSIDIALQQLFRVRQLVEGGMHIFALDLHHDTHAPAVYDDDVEKLLDDDMELVNKFYATNNVSFYAHQKVDGGQLKYDKDRLSYQILKGIVTLRNRSFAFFLSTLQNTLQGDYNIPCVLDDNDASITDEDSTFMSEIENKLASQAPPWSPDLVISQEEYRLLEYKQEMTPLEQLQKRVYEVAVQEWKIQGDKIDADLYKNYIISNNAYDRIYEAKRYLRMLTSSYDDIQKEFARKLDIMLDSCDPNMELFKNRMMSYYEKLLSGILVLKTCFKELDWKTKLVMKEQLTIHENDIDAGYKEFLGALNAEEKKKFNKLYQFSPNSTSYICFKKVMGGFGLDVRRLSANTKRPGNKSIVVDTQTWDALIESYDPQLFAVKI